MIPTPFIFNLKDYNMQYTINQLYDLEYQKVHDIYDIFKGFFGEDNVDLQPNTDKNVALTSIKAELNRQGIQVNSNDNDISYEITDRILEILEGTWATAKATIYVWWSNVTITNEYDKSINIQDLYAKIEVQCNGRIPYENWGFLLNRATYTEEQFNSGYLHSHIMEIPKYNFKQFQKPCMGKGPIKETILTLKNDYDETIWMLFCQELAMYVTVESLTGVPYNKLEEVGNKYIMHDYKDYNYNYANTLRFLENYSSATLKDFIGYYLKKGHLTLSYRNGRYTCGMPYYEYIIDISNAFIDYYNEHLATTKDNKNRLFNTKLLKRALVANNKFYSNQEDDTNYNIDRYRNQLVLIFKGREIRTTITESTDSETTWTTILDNGIAMYILKNILRTINYRYKRYEYNRNTAEETSSTSKRAIYL